MNAVDDNVCECSTSEHNTSATQHIINWHQYTMSHTLLRDSTEDT